CSVLVLSSACSRVSWPASSVRTASLPGSSTASSFSQRQWRCLCLFYEVQNVRRNDENSRAVSGVVGEMLMIGIVLVLAAVFTAQLPNYLPSERSSTVTIMMSNDTSGNVTLWHKGGDWVKVNDLKVIVSNQTYQSNYTYTGTHNFTFVPD